LTGSLRVIATAGHVDHGKSALIIALTGIDPDRFAEEKRRGLTIDLGYAWRTFPSGNEVGFVDVPGHERFIRTMLAGVGPVRLVLFVVAADEGWKPQTEEHLQILDVLGVAGGVIALTKSDLVDTDGLALATAAIRERVAGTTLGNATIVPVSARTGEGLDDLVAALDRMVTDAPAPLDARTRLFVDRVFSITGAGTVATGTLTGGCLHVDDEVTVEPGGTRGRIRSLQTHKRDLPEACHVSRVAANLVGVDRAPAHRGSVVCAPGAFRATTVFEAVARPVRGLERIPERGAFTVHAGANETTARLRVLEQRGDGEVLLRIRTDDALVLDVADRFVLWESGGRHTVGGGIVLDVAPPRAADPRHVAFLSRRATAPDRATIAELCVAEAGAIRADELALRTGSTPSPTSIPLPTDGWYVDVHLGEAVAEAVTTMLRATHEARPLDEGAALAEAREATTDALRRAGSPTDPALVDALLTRLHDAAAIVRDGMTVRLPIHRVALAGHQVEIDRLVAAVSGAHAATPPTIKELVAAGFDPSLIEAAARAGVIVRIGPDLALSPAVIERARGIVGEHAADGLTVSALREALGTSRKYAVPLAEWMDATGITRRVGDLRFPRGDAPS
jgi:selenocysteine-specific elongation factor